MAENAPDDSIPSAGTPAGPVGDGFQSWALPDGFDNLDVLNSMDLANSIAGLKPAGGKTEPTSLAEELVREPDPTVSLLEPALAHPASQTNLPDSEVPPTPLALVEAVLFLGGPPRSEASMAEALPGVNPGEFARHIQQLNERYQAQNRPYRIVRQEKGWQMLLRPAHRAVADRLRGEAPTLKLEGTLLETLAVVAYRQPIKRADLDALRGGDSSGPLRQLARMGLIRGEGSRETTYRTTPAFLKLFSIDRLEDLPRPVDLEKQ
ncbi:MAG: SMC-Scp complex subunit ScpB [Gemmataceae bacterium]